MQQYNTSTPSVKLGIELDIDTVIHAFSHVGTAEMVQPYVELFEKYGTISFTQETFTEVMRIALKYGAQRGVAFSRELDKSRR